jgi:hypothetical protein
MNIVDAMLDPILFRWRFMGRLAHHLEGHPRLAHVGR